MTNWQHITIKALARCRLQAYSSNKRFVLHMDALPVTAVLSERQDAYLWSVAWMYRRSSCRG